MGITPSNNNRLMENFYRHQMLQRDESHIGREKLSLLADISKSRSKTWRYRGIHLHCSLLYLHEGVTACTVVKTHSPRTRTESGVDVGTGTGTGAVIGLSCIPNPLTPIIPRAERLLNQEKELKMWRLVVVVDIQQPHYIRIRSDDPSCEFDQWMNVLEGIHLLVSLDFLSDAQISEGGCLDETQLKMSYQLLANGIISPPHTQSRTCNMTVKSSTEQSDKPIFKTSKECSLSSDKECSLSSTKECSLSSNKECSLATSHFSVGEKVEILSLLTDSRIDNSKEVWRGAKIIMIKKNNIRIHFLGWDKRWDTTIDVLKDGDRIKKCVSFLPILKSKNSNRASGRARNSSSPSFVSVSTIFESKKFYDALSMINESGETPSEQNSPEPSMRSMTSMSRDVQATHSTAVPCLEVVSKMDDYASNSLNDRHSYRLGTKQSPSNFIKNIENIKNDEIFVVSDNYEKLLDGKNYQSVDMNNYDAKNNLSSRDKMIENEKLINYKKHFESNCETVFTKLGNIQNKNGNPENSLIHSRLFSSAGSPNSSVELFENEKTRDMKLNRNADCPDFLPNIVKELKCFQLSKIDEEIQIQDEKYKENFLLKSMNVLLNNLIEIEKEKEKEKEIEKEKGKISLKLNENNLFLVNGKFIENNKNLNEENFLIPNFHNFGIKKNNNRKDIVNGNKNKINENNNNNNSIFFSRGEREKDNKEKEKDNSQFEKELDEEKEKELTHVINKWSPF